jgi:hypothetical protein
MASYRKSEVLTSFYEALFSGLVRQMHMMIMQWVRQSVRGVNEQISITGGMSCEVLDWWKENSARLPLIAKAAKIVLATPASEAICERLFKRAKHTGTTDRMARLPYETFDMLVMAQYNIARHGGVEAMVMSMFSMTIVV